MDIAAAYREARRIMPPESLGRVDAVPTVSMPKRRTRFPNVVASLREFEAVVDTQKRQLAVIIASAEAEARPVDAPMIRTVIDEMESDERVLAAGRQADLKTFARGRVTLRRRDPDALAEYGRLADRYKGMMTSLLEAMRDTRWQLMCVAAELEKGEEGPVFDDPKALRRYLNAVLRA